MNKEMIKNIIRTTITILAFIFIKYIQYVPIILLKLDPQDLTDVQIYLLSIFSYLVFIILLFFMYRKDLASDFQSFRENFWEYTDTAIKWWFVGLAVMMISNLLIQTFTPNKIANNEESVDAMIKNLPFLALIITTFLAPFTEEMTFRKSFYDILKNHKIIYVLVSGLIFGALHVVSSVENVYDYLYIIPYSAPGICFAIMDYKSKNIFPSIMIHTVHNGILTVLQILISGNIL